MTKRLTVDKINSAIEFFEAFALQSQDTETSQNYSMAIQALTEKKNRVGAQERFARLFKRSEEATTSVECFGVQMTISDIET